MAEIGRLIRESNPVPNSKPGYTPQHQLADGSYAVTGVNFNLPVTDAITQARLNTTIAELQNLKAQLAGIIDGSAPANTQLTGSNVLLSGTDVAYNENRVLTPSTPFSYLNLTNQGEYPITFSINEDSTTATNTIVLYPGEEKNVNIQGNSLHYSANNDTLFSYILGGGV